MSGWGIKPISTTRVLLTLTSQDTSASLLCMMDHEHFGWEHQTPIPLWSHGFVWGSIPQIYCIFYRGKSWSTDHPSLLLFSLPESHDKIHPVHPSMDRTCSRVALKSCPFRSFYRNGLNSLLGFGCYDKTSARSSEPSRSWPNPSCRLWLMENLGMKWLGNHLTQVT